MAGIADANRGGAGPAGLAVLNPATDGKGGSQTSLAVSSRKLARENEEKVATYAKEREFMKGLDYIAEVKLKINVNQDRRWH